MYAAILRALPIPTFFKVLLVILVLAGVTALCFLVIFPEVIQYIPFPYGNAGYPETPQNLEVISSAD